MTDIVIDIETIPSQLPWVKEYVTESVKPPGTMKKQETIDKWILEEKSGAIDEAMDKCSFDGAMNHIICIGIAIDNDDPIAIVAETIEQEAEILKSFYEVLRGVPHSIANTYIGHNISGFDMRVIRQRSMVLGVKPMRGIPFDSKPWDKNPFDTMMQWDSKNMVKLDKIARAFGLQGKGDIDGSQVYQLWKDKKFSDIAKYCKDDVIMTRNVYRKMKEFFL